MRLIDLTGKKYGKLTVIERAGSCKSGSQWKCICECGKESIVAACNLKNGEVKSCGCLNIKHGLRYTNLYRKWDGIKKRCNNEKTPQYKDYGGRGIRICPEWENNFKAFYDWAMANGYKEGLTIERIDNNGNYEPSNCRWATPKEQANNRRNTPYITYNGVTKTSREWDDYFGIRSGTINKRMNCGMTAEKAMQGLIPNQKARLITFQGKTMNIRQWAKYLGIKYCTLVGRLSTRKWTVEKAFTASKYQRG
jgi:hypothetical protein